MKIKGEIHRIEDIFYNLNTQDTWNQNGMKIRQWNNCFPLVESTLDFLEEGYKLQIWLKALTQRLQYNNDGSTTPLKIYDERLHDYQNKSVANMLLMKNIGVFNQQRTGKTPTVLIAIREKKFKKTIITMKASLLLQWKEEIIKWLGYDPILVNHPPKKRKELYEKFKQSNKEEILLVSYDTLKLDWLSLQGARYDCLVIDEADFVRNNSKRRENLLKVRSCCDFCWLLTGTPTVNGKHDIVPLISFMYQKVAKYKLYNYFFFTGIQKFGKTKKNKEMFKTNFIFQESLSVVLQQWLELFTLNTKREEVWKLIPPVKETVIHVPMCERQKKHYYEILHYYATGSYGNEVLAKGVLAIITRLRQIMLDPRIIEDLNSNIVGAKTKQIMQYVKDFHKEKKIIIFADYTKYLNLLSREFTKIKINTGLFTGEVKQNERNEVKHAFQDGDLNVILVNTEAGAKGLTLSSGDVIIFAQNSYSYILREQAMDRFIAQDDRPREIIDYVCENSDNIEENIEESILDIQKFKKNQTDLVNNWKKILTEIRNKTI